MKVTSKSVTVEARTARASGRVEQPPGVKSSYWLSELAKPLPVTTITPPLKPNSEPIAKPASTIRTERWKSRLPGLAQVAALGGQAGSLAALVAVLSKR